MASILSLPQCIHCVLGPNVLTYCPPGDVDVIFKGAICKHILVTGIWSIR